MPISISVIDILNSEHQLNSLPVGENIEVLFSEQPDLTSIDNYVALVRVDSDQDVPNFGDIYVHRITDETGYSTVLSEFSVDSGSSGWTLNINPEEFLMPNSNYYLVIDKDLTPKHYTISKPTSLGPSTIGVKTESSGSSEDATYDVVVSSTSNLSNGQHLVMVDISKNGGPSVSHALSLKDNNTVELNDTVSIVLNPNTPYLNTEHFSIVLQEIVRLGDTKIQSISTFIDSDVIENAEETSTRLEQQDLLDFYSNTEWVKQENEPLVSEATISGHFQYPNKIVIDMGSEIDISTINPSAFDISISHAFDNYLLPQMGLYNESDKFVIKYEPSTPISDKIYLTIEKDTNNLVPSEDKFIIVSV